MSAGAGRGERRDVYRYWMPAAARTSVKAGCRELTAGLLAVHGKERVELTLSCGAEGGSRQHGEGSGKGRGGGAAGKRAR